MPSEPSMSPATTELMDATASLQPGSEPGPAPAGEDGHTQQQQMQPKQQQQMQMQQHHLMQQQQQQQQQPPAGGGGGNGSGMGGFPPGYQNAPGYGPAGYGAGYGGHYPMHPGAYGGGAGGYQMGMHPGAAPYGGGPYPYGRPPYPYGGYPGDSAGGGGAPGGFYPGHQQRVKQSSHGRSSRGGHTSLPSPRRNTTTLGNVTSTKGAGPNDMKSGITEEARKQETMEIERLRKAAEKDLSQTDVKPIQSDFHFFVTDMRDKLKVAAEEEVRKISKSEEKKLDMYLVNSNLNCRLMKAWEDLTVAEREVYAVREQEDRRRFMQDDEVASRHCATLTARARSPCKKGSANEGGEGDDAEVEGDAKRQPETNEEDLESPSKKNRVAEVEV